MIMKFLQLLIIFLITMQAFGQSKIPSDTVKIGRASTVVDKGIIFETNDGANNKKLLIEQSSKLLKFDGNQFRLGDASAGLKEFIFNNNDATNPKLSVDFNADILIYNKDNFTIGDGTNTDKTWTFDIGGSNPFLRYDSAANAIVFSNDGTLTKKIGSGGGGAGGQNFFAELNPDAESGTNNWTETGGGTFVTNGTTPINSDNDFSWDSSAQNDVLRTDQVLIPEKFKGRACEVNFTYTGGTDDLVKPQVVNSSFVKLPGATYINQVDGTDFLQAQTGIVQRTIFFICPTSGTIAFEFLQTEVGNPVEMNFDDVFIGELIGLQTTVIDTDWADCGFVTGDFGAGWGTVSAIELFCRRDSTDLLISGSVRAGTVTSNTGEIDLTTIGFTIDLTKVASGSTYKFGTIHTVKVGITAFGTNAGIYFSDGVDDDTIFFGRIGASQTVWTKENLNSIITTNDSATINLRIPVVENAAQPVKIFTSIPKVAEVNNVFSARLDADASNPAVFSTSFDWLDSGTPISRTGIGIYVINFKASIFSVLPACQFTGGSVAVTRVIVTIEALTTSAITVAVTNNSGSEVDADFTIKCQKQGVDFFSAVIQPIIVGQVTNSKAEDGGTDNIRTEACAVINSGTPTIDTTSTLCAAWIDSLTDVGVGLVELNLTAGIFSLQPLCTCTSFNASFRNCNVVSATTSVIRVNTNTYTPSADDHNFIVSCKGVR